GSPATRPTASHPSAVRGGYRCSRRPTTSATVKVLAIRPGYRCPPTSPATRPRPRGRGTMVRRREIAPPGGAISRLVHALPCGRGAGGSGQLDVREGDLGAGQRLAHRAGLLGLASQLVEARGVDALDCPAHGELDAGDAGARDEGDRRARVELGGRGAV